MLRFFRQIRHRLLTDNKVSKYLLYAIGEIMLVVIGILIALQVDNWNTRTSENQRVLNYYQKINGELSLAFSEIHYFQKSIDTLIILNKKSLHILNLKNKDSLVHLKESIGALGTAYLANFTFPIIEEFLGQGLLSKIENDSLKFGFQRYKMAIEDIKELDSYTSNQYATSIEPYFYKNINYANVVFDDYNELVKGGPETDYSKFYDNLELYNLLTFKLELLMAQQNRVAHLKMETVRKKSMSCQTRKKDDYYMKVQHHNFLFRNLKEQQPAYAPLLPTNPPTPANR